MKDEMKDERSKIKVKGEWWKMKDERWKMKDERWKMKDERTRRKDERWEIRNEGWEGEREERRSTGIERHAEAKTIETDGQMNGKTSPLVWAHNLHKALAVWWKALCGFTHAAAPRLAVQARRFSVCTAENLNMLVKRVADGWRVVWGLTTALRNLEDFPMIVWAVCRPPASGLFMKSDCQPNTFKYFDVDDKARNRRRMWVGWVSDRAVVGGCERLREN